MRERLTLLILLGTILLLGFGLRVHYLLHVSPIPDEYITMLATDATLKWGYPRLPSKLYYDHGLLFTYVDALFAGVFGLDETVTRVPSLVFGMITIATVYRAGQDWFSSKAGLMAAAIVALSPEAITWGARARMYSLWMWLFFLATFWLASGFLVRNSKRLRCLGIVALIGAAFSHILTLAFAAPLAGGLALGWLLSRQQMRSPIRLRDIIWPESLLAVVGAVALISLRDLSGRWGISERAMLDQAWLANPLALAARAGVAASPFFRPPLLIAGMFAITGMLFLVFRLTRSAEPYDRVLACLSVVFVGCVIGVGTLSRYYADSYVSAMLPVFALLAGRELASVGDLLGQRSSWLIGLCIPLALAVGPLAPNAWGTATTDRINIDRAYAFIRENRSSNDVIATTSPAAGSLLLGGSDVYISANSRGPCTTGTDKWIGIPHYTCPEDFADLLAAETRVWFVADDWFWEHSLSPEFQEVIEAHMDLVFHPDGARVYLHDE